MPEVLQKLDNMSHRCLKIFTLIPHSQLEKSTPKMKVMISMLKLYPPSFLCSFSSVQFNGSVVFKYLWPHGLQHTRLPCPSPTPKACSNSCPLSWWCHPTISSSVIPFLLLPSIFPSIRVFSTESVLHIRWPNYWSFSFSISQSFQWIFRHFL